MTNEDLEDLANSAILKTGPLSTEEIQAVMIFCKTKMCDGDLPESYKLFYSKAYDVLSNELQKTLN